MITNDDIGHIVNYWNNGNRFGVLLGIEGSTAVIKNPNKTKKRNVKVPIADCEVYKTNKEEKKMPSIFEELTRISAVGEQSSGQSDTAYIELILISVGSLSEDDWNKLSTESQTWFNEAVVKKNKMQPLPECPGFKGSQTSSPRIETPPKGLTATEILSNPTTIIIPPVHGTDSGRVQSVQPNIANTPKQKKKTTGIMDALRKTVVMHTDWTARQIWNHLKANGFPDAKLDTVSVDSGNYRRVIEIAKEMGFWIEKPAVKE